MPPQQGDKELPGTDKRDSRFQAGTEGCLHNSQLIFIGCNLGTGIQGRKSITLSLLAPDKAFPMSGWSWKSPDLPQDSITLGKEIGIIKLISCVLLKSVPHRDLQDRWTVLKTKQNKANPSKDINLILDKRRLYKVLERENSFCQHLCATWESIYLSLTYTTFSNWK